MRSLLAAIVLAIVLPNAFAADTLFVRTSEDGSRTILGRSASPEAEVHCIHFTIAEEPVMQWPSPVTITITDRESAAKWSVGLESRNATRPHSVCVSAGSYELLIAAQHYGEQRRQVRLRDTDVRLGTISLARNPEITGAVRDAAGAPLGGAFVTDLRRLSAKTDSHGAFSIEVTDDWPSEIEIAYPGLTTRRLALPKTRASVSLPAVTLVKGSRLDLQVENAADAFDVDLTRETQHGKSEVVRTAHGARGTTLVSFEDLEKGDYAAVIRGAGSLERFVAPVRVGETESVARTVRIDPIAVTIEVLRGGAPLPAAFVGIRSEGNRWSSEMQADSSGKISTRAWQSGRYLFAVRAKESSPPVLLLNAIESGDETSVVLDVPDRSVSGRVVDADNDSPLEKAEVQIVSVNDDDTGGTSTAFTGPDGKFVLDSIRDGSHTLVAEANGYAQSDPVSVRIDGTVPHREVTFRMNRGTLRRLRVVSLQNAPVAGALVIAMANDVATELTGSDSTGAVAIHTRPGVAPTVYVLPAEGSLAIARLSLAASDKEETIVVRDGNASLELHANDASGKPLANLRFVMRFDGELIPPDVADLLEVRRGMVPATGRDGVARLDRLPAGLIEMWPVRTHDEMMQVYGSGAVNAPVRVALQNGINVVTMTFERKP